VILEVFWEILGLGLAIPTWAVLLYNLGVAARSGGSYLLDLKKVGILYFVGLIGVSLFFGVRGG